MENSIHFSIFLCKKIYRIKYEIEYTLSSTKNVPRKKKCPHLHKNVQGVELWNYSFFFSFLRWSFGIILGNRGDIESWRHEILMDNFACLIASLRLSNINCPIKVILGQRHHIRIVSRGLVHLASYFIWWAAIPCRPAKTWLSSLWLRTATYLTGMRANLTWLYRVRTLTMPHLFTYIGFLSDCMSSFPTYMSLSPWLGYPKKKKDTPSLVNISNTVRDQSDVLINLPLH